MKNDSIVAGGGAIDMELSKYLRNHSRTVAGKEQLIIGAMAKAFEVIARQLCDNAGFDATNILNKLRQKHASDGIWYGVDVLNEDIADNFDACVWYVLHPIVYFLYLFHVKSCYSVIIVVQGASYCQV